MVPLKVSPVDLRGNPSDRHAAAIGKKQRNVGKLEERRMPRRNAPSFVEGQRGNPSRIVGENRKREREPIVYSAPASDRFDSHTGAGHCRYAPTLAADNMRSMTAAGRMLAARTARPSDHGKMI
jgi:hypothetical protein